MSAKEITIFIPKNSLIEPSLADLAHGLSMTMDDLSPTPGLTYQFSARRGKGQSLLSLEYKQNDCPLIEEINQWEHPSQEYKGLLLKCQSSITVRYRNLAYAKEALAAISLSLEDAKNFSMVENGLGCLLKLKSILESINQDTQWSWEKYEFPELPEVAISEWR